MVMTPKERAEKAYNEAVNTECLDDFDMQKDECSVCMQQVMASAIAEAEAALIDERNDLARRLGEAIGLVEVWQKKAELAQKRADEAAAVEREACWDIVQKECEVANNTPEWLLLRRICIAIRARGDK